MDGKLRGTAFAVSPSNLEGYDKMIEGVTLPEVWELGLLHILEHGQEIKTAYDKPGDPLSLDCPIALTVWHPFHKPRVHRCFWGSPRDLLDYIEEVVRGTQDHLVGQLGYTYHARLTDYGGIDQIEGMIKVLKETLYSRRAQAITWHPRLDLGAKHPPCLQRIWARVIGGKLVFHAHMRSWDYLKAGIMNMIAFTELQAWIAQRLGISPGYYWHTADSAHIYGVDRERAQGVVNRMDEPLEQRAWTMEEIGELAGY